MTGLQALFIRAGAGAGGGRAAGGAVRGVAGFWFNPTLVPKFKAAQHGATAWAPAQVVDERLAGSSVEYLQLNELSEALQRNLQSMHHAKCLFMMRAWHQARLGTFLSQQGCRPGRVESRR